MATRCTRCRAAATISSTSSDCCWRARQPPTQVQTALTTAAVQLGQQAAILQTAGARYIMVWTAPDMGNDPERSRDRTGGDAHRAVQFVQHNAQLDAVYARRAGDPPQRLRAAERNTQEPGGIRDSQRRPASPARRRSTVTIATCNPSTLVSPTAPSTYFFADGGAPDDRGPQDPRRLRLLGRPRPATSRRARRGAARHRAGELARARRPDVLVDQHPPDGQVRGLGRVRLFEPGLRQRFHDQRRREPQLHLRRRRHQALAAPDRGHDGRLHAEQGRLRQRRLQAQPDDRHRLRRLGRRPVVRRRDARRQRPRLQQHLPRHHAGRADANRIRRHAGLHDDRPAARRLLVHV